LAEEAALPLAVVARIAGPAPIADADVQVMVDRAERERAAVVIARGAVLDQEHRVRAGFDGVCPCGVRREPRHDDVAPVARVEDVQEVVRRELAVEREAEEPALAAILDLRADVEEVARLEDAALDDA